MQIRYRTLTLKKRYPLTISRGTSAESTNLLVEVEHEGITGIGEMAPVSIGYGEETAEGAAGQLDKWPNAFDHLTPWEMQGVDLVLDFLQFSRALRAAVDMALHDWIGKRTGTPLYRLLGACLKRIPPTSVTIGINPPEVLREQVPEIVARTGARALKVKLGSPDGLEADRAAFSAVRESAPASVKIRVDANGGWDVRGTHRMLRWLAARDVEFVEQPLPIGAEADLKAFLNPPLRIFADESCRVASDVPKLAGLVQGINLKLMKAGGIREALRIIHTARAHYLRVMMGCMSESSLAIAASVHMSSYADYLDLDSHLNLLSDPCSGLRCEDGRILPNDSPGLGVKLSIEN